MPMTEHSGGETPSSTKRSNDALMTSRWRPDDALIAFLIRWRNAFFNNESLRSSCSEMRCRKHTVSQAVKSEPPSELLAQLQFEPQLRTSAPALQAPSQSPPTPAKAEGEEEEQEEGGAPGNH